MFGVFKDKQKDTFNKVKNGSSLINKIEYTMPISILADEDKLERDRFYYYPNSSVHVENVTIHAEDPLLLKAFYKQNLENYEKTSTCVKLLISFSPSLTSYRSGIGNLVKIKATQKKYEEKTPLKLEYTKNEINVDKNSDHQQASSPIFDKKFTEDFEDNQTKKDKLVVEEKSDKIGFEEVQNNLTDHTLIKEPLEKSYQEQKGLLPISEKNRVEEVLFTLIERQENLNRKAYMNKEIPLEKQHQILLSESISPDICQPTNYENMENKEAFILSRPISHYQDPNFSQTKKNTEENLYRIECIEKKEHSSDLFFTQPHVIPQDIKHLNDNHKNNNDVDIKEKYCMLTCMSLIKFSEIKSNDEINKSQIYMYKGDPKNIKTFFKKLDFIVQNPSIEDKLEYLKSLKQEYKLQKLKIDITALNSRADFLEADSKEEFDYLFKDPKRKMKINPGLDVMILNPCSEKEDFFSLNYIELDLDHYITEPKNIEDSNKEKFVTFITYHIPRAINHEFSGKNKILKEIIKTAEKEGVASEIKNYDKVICYDDQRDLEFGKSCCIYYDRSINFGKIDPKNMGGIRIGHYIFNSFSTGTLLFDSQMKPYGISYYGSFDYYPPTLKKPLYNLLIPFSHPGIHYIMRKLLFPDDDINICEFIRNSQSFKFYEEFKKNQLIKEEKEVVNKPNDNIVSDNDMIEDKMEVEKISETSQENKISENDIELERESEIKADKEKISLLEPPQEETKLEKSNSKERLLPIKKKKKKFILKKKIKNKQISESKISHNSELSESTDSKNMKIKYNTPKAKFYAKRTCSNSNEKKEEKFSKSSKSKSSISKRSNYKTNKNKTNSFEDSNIYSIKYHNKRDKADSQTLRESEEQISGYFKKWNMSVEKSNASLEKVSLKNESITGKKRGRSYSNNKKI